MTHTKRKELMDRLQLEAIPIMTRILNAANPEEYTKWAGNCCRQAAMFAHMYLLDQVAEGADVVRSFESEFTCIMRGKEMMFDHSWVYAELGAEKFVIDYLPSVHGIRILESQNDSVSWEKHAYFSNVKDLVSERKMVGFQERLTQPEYYTGRWIAEIYMDVIEEMNK